MPEQGQFAQAPFRNWDFVKGANDLLDCDRLS